MCKDEQVLHRLVKNIDILGQNGVRQVHILGKQTIAFIPLVFDQISKLARVHFANATLIFDSVHLNSVTVVLAFIFRHEINVALQGPQKFE